MADVNPFVYSRPVAPADVVGRDAELEQLLGLARGGHYATVSAPRRYGKTSLLDRVARDARTEGMAYGQDKAEKSISRLEWFAQTAGWALSAFRRGG
jgi:hypothetical protein